MNNEDKTTEERLVEWGLIEFARIYRMYLTLRRLEQIVKEDEKESDCGV